MARNRSEHVPEWLHRAEATHLHLKVCVEADGQHTLLHDTVSGTDDSPDWRFWLKQVGVDGVDPDRGPGYSDTGMVLAAAITGQGVALGRSSLSDDDVAAGLLIRPFGPTLPTRYAYYLASPEAISDRPKIRVFRDWLLEEAGIVPPSSN